MRMAHIIMVHKDPDQLERLLKSLQHPAYDFYIHVDKKSDIQPFLRLSGIGQVYFIKNRHICNWGGNSLFTTIVSCMNEALRSGIPYDFINLLSGQDYPVKSAEYIYNFFLQHPGVSFISCESFEGSEWWETAKDRYQHYHFTDWDFKGKYLLQKIVNAIMPIRKFPLSVPLYGGNKACWWTLSTDCASYVTTMLERNPALRRFLKYCWATDEFVIPTLIMSSPFSDKVMNNNYRYIDWSEGNAHPKILRREDLGKMLAADVLFARKFDRAVDALVLDQIDAHIHQ